MCKVSNFSKAHEKWKQHLQIYETTNAMLLKGMFIAINTTWKCKISNKQAIYVKNLEGKANQR